MKQDAVMHVEKSVVIKNKQGLHARPAALFVQIANKFDSEITVSKGKLKVNGKSIMGIMMLAASMGTMVTVDASGPQAKEAVDALEILVASKFDED